MKTALLLLAVIVMCAGEGCQDTQECQQHHQTICGRGSTGHIGCSEGFCTCLEPQHNNTMCNTRDDCVKLNVHHQFCKSTEHCVDNNCRCERQQPTAMPPHTHPTRPHRG